MKVFPERLKDLDAEIKDRLEPCRKKPLVISAVQMRCEFRVKTLEGDYKLGKPGDYLLCGVDEELYICDRKIFEKTYDWVKER